MKIGTKIIGINWNNFVPASLRPYEIDLLVIDRTSGPALETFSPGLPASFNPGCSGSYLFLNPFYRWQHEASLFTEGGLPPWFIVFSDKSIFTPLLLSMEEG